jgi:hypothetical protein
MHRTFLQTHPDGVAMARAWVALCVVPFGPANKQLQALTEHAQGHGTRLHTQQQSVVSQRASAADGGLSVVRAALGVPGAADPGDRVPMRPGAIDSRGRGVRHCHRRPRRHAFHFLAPLAGTPYVHALLRGFSILGPALLQHCLSALPHVLVVVEVLPLMRSQMRLLHSKVLLRVGQCPDGFLCQVQGC